MYIVGNIHKKLDYDIILKLLKEDNVCFVIIINYLFDKGRIKSNTTIFFSTLTFQNLL